MPDFDLLSSLNKEATQQDVLAAVALVLTAVQERLTDAQLRASELLVADDFDGDVLTADQTGAGAVLTFNLGGPAKLVAVDVDAASPSDTATYIARVSVSAATPSASLGWRCRSGQVTFLPVPCESGVVKVFAPSGVTVSVQAATRV